MGRTIANHKLWKSFYYRETTSINWYEFCFLWSK